MSCGNVISTKAVFVQIHLESRLKSSLPKGLKRYFD